MKHEAKTRLTIRRRPHLADGSRGLSQDVEVPCTVTVHLDLDGIVAVLGRKALMNKSSKSSEIGGLVKVYVTEHKP